MSRTMLRIGTRGSQLALCQAEFVRRELQRLADVQSEIVIIKTSGDVEQKANVGTLGLKGVFIKELEDALLSDRVDLAIHSMKDVPTEILDGLCIAAIAERADVRDCLLCSNSLQFRQLPGGAIVGTSSLRRQAQLLRMRPDIRVAELRGNVDTRLKKLDRGDVQAITLAKAGLDRLGWAGRITEIFSPEEMLPAVGQGALGIECRTTNSDLRRLLAGLEHSPTRIAVTAERSLLARLEGGCQVPLGAWGRMENGKLMLDACVLSADGLRFVFARESGDPSRPEQIGESLAEQLFAGGAREILALAGRSADVR